MDNYALKNTLIFLNRTLFISKIIKLAGAIYKIILIIAGIFIIKELPAILLKRKGK